MREALRAPDAVVRAVRHGEAPRRHADLLAELPAGVPVAEITDEGRRRAVRDGHPAGARRSLPGSSTSRSPSVLERRRGWLAVLRRRRDPGNAGTVLRTADAAGAGAVVFAGDSVDPYNGKAVRASAGSLFHLPVVVDGAIRALDLVPPARAADTGARRDAAPAPSDLVDTAGTGRPVAVRQRGARPAARPARGWPTGRSGSRSTAGPRASTSRPPRPSASTRAPRAQPAATRARAVIDTRDARAPFGARLAAASPLAVT